MPPIPPIPPIPPMPPIMPPIPIVNLDFSNALFFSAITNGMTRLFTRHISHKTTPSAAHPHRPPQAHPQTPPHVICICVCVCVRHTYKLEKPASSGARMIKSIFARARVCTRGCMRPYPPSSKPCPCRPCCPCRQSILINFLFYRQTFLNLQPLTLNGSRWICSITSVLPPLNESVDHTQ